MADDLKTLREASLAIQGVHNQLKLHTAVFGVSIIAALAVCGFFYNKLDSVSASTSTIDATMKAETKSVDDKFVALNNLIKEHNAQIDEKIGKLIASQNELGTKVDKISQKLHVASSKDDLYSGNEKDRPFASLVDSGYKVVKLGDFPNDAGKKAALVKQIIEDKDWYAVTPDTSDWQKVIAIIGDQNPKPYP